MPNAQKNNKQIIVIIGYGNMAKSIAIALDKQGKYALEICGRDTKKARDFIAQCGLKNASVLDLAKTNATKPKQASDIKSSPKSAQTTLQIPAQDKILLLCIKPYGLASFGYEGRAKAVYSTLAGINIATLKSHISAQYFVRLMPNVGARFGLSASAVFVQDFANDSPHDCDISPKDEAQEIIESFGNAVFVASENLIDSAIATSGSAPAFIALVAQSLIDAGVQEGLTRADSASLVRATFRGFASLLDLATPQEIIDMVTTPAGTTAQGLAVLESKAVRGAFLQACKASVKKAKNTTNAKNANKAK